MCTVRIKFNSIHYGYIHAYPEICKWLYFTIYDIFSVNVQEGMGVWKHALAAIFTCFGILTSCTLGTNLLYYKIGRKQLGPIRSDSQWSCIIHRWCIDEWMTRCIGYIRYNGINTTFYLSIHIMELVPQRHNAMIWGLLFYMMFQVTFTSQIGLYCYLSYFVNIFQSHLISKLLSTVCTHHCYYYAHVYTYTFCILVFYWLIYLTWYISWIINIICSWTYFDILNLSIDIHVYVYVFSCRCKFICLCICKL